MSINRNLYTAGVDIGGTYIKLVLLDGHGVPTAESSMETKARAGPAQAINRLAVALKALFIENGVEADRLAAVGIGAAGPLDIHRGTVVQAPNLPGWEGAPIVDLLAAKLEAPIFFENDANLAAFGEYERGAGKGAESLVCLTLGTGIGGGIILDGEIYRGASGAGAELGHITIETDGPLCNCGNYGCLEAMASATAVARMGAEAVRERRSALISDLAGGDPSKVEAETVHKAALDGDEIAMGILARAGRSLGVGIAGLINIFAPRIVVVGGGLMNTGHFILEPAREEAARRALKSFMRGVSIVPAELGGSAGAIGAACYARHKIEGR